MAQASPSPSPHRSSPEDPPPLTPMQERAADEYVPPPHSTAIVVAAAARYVPPPAATHTASDGRSWYPWNGGRTPHPPRPAPQQRTRPQPQPREEEAPPPPPRTRTRPQPREEAPPPTPPPPRVVAPPSPAPAPAPRAPRAPARSVERDHRVVPDILSRKRRAAALQRTALVARGTAAGLCLAALAVLAADSRKGWALDSYSRYTQLRYSEAVNVIGFLYSLFQFVVLAELIRRNKHLIARPKGDYFDFIMDQVLAYLLISSSSSATARTGDWIDNWGSDPFPNMANSSITISFLAFLVFAINALISAYNLFRRDL